MSENDIALLIVTPGFVLLAVQLARLALVMAPPPKPRKLPEGTQEDLDRIMTRSEQLAFAKVLMQFGNGGVSVDEAAANLASLR